MKYYNIDKNGISETPEIEVKECILKGIIKGTEKKIKLVMGEKEFNEWRGKIKEEK